MLDFKKIITDVKAVAYDAGKIMFTKDFKVENKGGLGNYVTTIDKNVQEFIKEKLSVLYPDITFIGEESDAMDYNAITAWIVDPIDGTANFIHGMNTSAISIGLLNAGKIVMGVVYNPYADEIFYAYEGGGAYVNDIPIKVSDRPFKNSLYATAFSLYKREFAEVCQDILREVYANCEDFRRFGTASIELTQLAAGRLDLYFEMRLSPWDYAASDIIIREAGGYIGTLYREEDDSSEMIYTRPIPVYAANTLENFNQLKDILKKYISRVPYTD